MRGKGRRRKMGRRREEEEEKEIFFSFPMEGITTIFF